MMSQGANLRQGPKDSYHDRVFEEEIYYLIQTTQTHYDA
jgi:leucyl-tRNA synthetase